MVDPDHAAFAIVVGEFIETRCVGNVGNIQDKQAVRCAWWRRTGCRRSIRRWRDYRFVPNADVNIDLRQLLGKLDSMSEDRKNERHRLTSAELHSSANDRSRGSSNPLNTEASTTFQFFVSAMPLEGV